MSKKRILLFGITICIIFNIFTFSNFNDMKSTNSISVVYSTDNKEGVVKEKTVDEITTEEKIETENIDSDISENLKRNIRIPDETIIFYGGIIAFLTLLLIIIRCISNRKEKK